MTMNPVPPFIPNSEDDVHCVAAVYRMIFKHYLNKDYSWNEIDTIAKATPGKGMWTVNLAIAAAKAGIRVNNIELTDYTKLYEGRSKYLKKTFGEKTATYYVEQSNILNIIDDIPEFIHLVPHESRKATLKDIVTHLQEGKLVAAEVNAGILNTHGKFNLHAVLLYDTDGSIFTFHDPGLPPIPSRRITLRDFEQCFAYPGASQGIDIFSKN